MNKVTGFFKSFGKKAKVVMCSVVSALTCVVTAVAVAAEDGASDTAIQTALTTGLTSTAGKIMLCVAAIIPIGLGIFGAKKAIEWAKKFFNKVSN